MAVERVANWKGYIAAVTGVAAVALLLYPVLTKVDSVTAATALLMVVLLVSTTWGFGPAMLTSVLGVVYLNFFFAPGFRIAAADELVALLAFLITAATVSQLSARARRRAEEAERSRAEVQRLYDELQAAFERSSELEAVRRSERLKSALLDAVTHDLRTPLTSIKAASTTLLAETPGEAGLGSEVRRELLQVVTEETDRLNHFVEEMLDLARLEGGGMRENPPAPLEEVVGTARLGAAAATLRHQVTAVVDDSSAMVPNGRAMSRVIIGLMENAAKYAPEGSGIRVVAAASDAKVRVSVEDEGPGVAAEERERIFQKFYRKPPPGAAQLPPGLGMGLAIARGLVEGIGGRVWVEDRSGGGARFVVEVPRAGAGGTPGGPA
jgi:K+-sensing histidine kinase KdpD